MIVDEAYAALIRFRSILCLLKRHEAHKEGLKPFHKSLIDHISRFGYFANIKAEGQQVKPQCALKVLKEAPGGIDLGCTGIREYAL
jgi:hypothetical protein